MRAPSIVSRGAKAGFDKAVPSAEEQPWSDAEMQEAKRQGMGSRAAGVVDAIEYRNISNGQIAYLRFQDTF